MAGFAALNPSYAAALFRLKNAKPPKTWARRRVAGQCERLSSESTEKILPREAGGGTAQSGLRDGLLSQADTYPQPARFRAPPPPHAGEENRPSANFLGAKIATLKVPPLMGQAFRERARVGRGPLCSTR
jgi:hypothetical protein